MTGNIHVVFAMDTEGPVTDKNQELLDTWGKLDDAMSKLFDRDYRKKYPDCDGGGFKISWFMLNWTGFKTNPVQRDFGYHKILDHYIKQWGSEISLFDDGIYWHYHHPPENGIGNEWSTDWTSNVEYFNILNHMIIDRHYFPSVFRAGGTIEDNDVSYWLEQWIPFDYSNRSGNINWLKKEADGRLLKEILDWSKAPSDWNYYHPSTNDYQVPGEMKRYIFNCLDVNSGVHQIKKSEIRFAFERANKGDNVILAFFEHDFRDIADHLEELFFKPLFDISMEFPDVKWYYNNANDAAQSILKTHAVNNNPIKFQVTLKDGDKLIIKSNTDLFGPQPYFVTKLIDEQIYKNYPLHVIGEKCWLHQLEFPNRTQIFGIASNDKFGNTVVTRYKYERKKDGNKLIQLDVRS